MRFLKFLMLLLGFIAFMMLQSCKENCPCDDPTNPTCENYDPCWGKDTINTFFKVRPGDNGFPPPEEWCDLIPCDTFNASSVRFDIPEGNPENSTYEWQIGSEAEPRKGKGFEVDFSDYLIAGKWETWISVSLTIRTPINDCLENPKNTLVTVTRELFFTKILPSIFNSGKTIAKYKGHFLSTPSNKVTIEFIHLTNGSFRGIYAPIGLVVGVPGVDTFAYNPPCTQSYCTSYLETIGRISNPAKCYPDATNYLGEFQFLSLDGAEKIKRVWVFDKPTGKEQYEFIGERVE